MISYSAEELWEMESQTDWEALEEKTNEEIREATESDPGTYLLDEDRFDAATLVNPQGRH